MQGRKGTARAQPGLSPPLPPPQKKKKKKKDEEPQPGLCFAESPTYPAGGLLIRLRAF